MNARALLVAPNGAIRAPWRVILFVLVVAASYVVSAVIAGPVIAAFLRFVGADGVTDESWVAVIALLVATAICIRVIDKRSWRDVWLDATAARPWAVVSGFAVGALAIGLPILALIGVGWLRLAVAAPGSWWGASLRVSLLLLPAALSEELLVRGYLLSVLRESWGWVWAIAATSIGFGLLHIENPGATPGSLTIVMLAGVFLATIVYAMRSLYAAWMAHFAWNFTMAVFFHAAVSGLPLESPGYRYVDAGPDWVTGGPWGPEGGLAAALGMVAGIALLVRRRAPLGAARRTNETQETV